MTPFRFAVAAGLVLVAGSLAFGQGTFPIKPEDVSEKTLGLVQQAERYLTNVEKPAADKLPADIGDKAAFFTLRVGGKDVLFAATAGKSVRLWVDTNADGSLADEKPLRRWTGSLLGSLTSALVGGGRESVASEFGPVTISPPGGAKVKLNVTFLNFGDGHSMFVVPASVLAGIARIGGKDYPVKIVDGRFDGTFAPFGPDAATSPGSTMLDIDLTGDAAAVPTNGGMPMPRLLSVGGAWYSLRVVDGGAALDVQKAEPKFGTLDVGTAEAEIDLTSDSGPHHVKGAGGKWQLPEGFYMLGSIEYKRPDKAGRVWALRAYFEDETKSHFALAADQTRSVKMGLPAVAKTEVHVAQGVARISLTFAGQGGERILPTVVRGDGGAEDAPKVKIYNELGKELASGQFEFG